MFSIKLKEIRESKGLSQKQLANSLDVSQGSVGNWESGIRQPNFDMLKKIADFFGISTDYFFGESENRFADEKKTNPAILNEISSLNEKEKEEVMSFIKFLKTRKE